MIAVDTNLLIFAHRSATEEHRTAREALERAAEGAWGIPLPVLGEFWSIVTHPAAAGRPSTPDEATAFVEALIRDGGAQLWYPASGFGERLFRLAVDLEVTGVRIFDLQIALIAFENGAREIWTHDRNFVAMPGLRVVDPLA